MLIPPSTSVTHRLPVVASVAGAEALAGLGVNHDALAVSPEMLDFQLMTLGAQNIHCIGRKAVFDENLIGEPLMMKPGRVHGFLYIKREIHDSYEYVGHRGDDSRSAGRTKHEKELAVFEHNSRRHGRERAFAWANGVGGALHESVDIRNTLFRGEVIHFMVEQEAQAPRSDARTERVVE